MYSGSYIEHCQSKSNILFCSNPLKTNNQTGILMDYRQIHAEEREEWNPKHTTTLHSALQHGALNVELNADSRAEIMEENHPVLEG